MRDEITAIVKHITTAKPCSRCREPQNRKNQRYCRTCHAAYMRENRPKYSELTELEKKKDAARSYAGVYQRRKKLLPQPCKCGSLKTEKHHPDYNNPLEVVWLCRPCHMEVHRQ